MGRTATRIVKARCEACGEPYHETLPHQWLCGARPRCGFCGKPLTRDDKAVRDETLYCGTESVAGPDYVLVRVDCVKGMTEKAILCFFGGEATWIPRSQVRGDGKGIRVNAVNVEIEVTRWWADKASVDYD